MRVLRYQLDGVYAPYCAEVFLREAEGVGLPVVEGLLATRVEKLGVTWSQYYVSLTLINKYQYRHRN